MLNLNIDTSIYVLLEPYYCENASILDRQFNIDEYINWRVPPDDDRLDRNM
jgi:hypothetical protein